MQYFYKNLKVHSKQTCVATRGWKSVRLFWSIACFFRLTQKQHFSWRTFFLTFFVSLISITPKPREAPGTLKTPPDLTGSLYDKASWFVSFQSLLAHLEIIRFEKNWLTICLKGLIWMNVSSVSSMQSSSQSKRQTNFKFIEQI